RTRLVTLDLLRQIEPTESFEAVLCAIVDAVVRMEAILDEQADDVERGPLAQVFHIERGDATVDVRASVAKRREQRFGVTLQSAEERSTLIRAGGDHRQRRDDLAELRIDLREQGARQVQIGRASCRERGGSRADAGALKPAEA